MAKEKTYVEQADRGIYDIKDHVKYKYISKAGLSEEIVRNISKEKNEPKWMLDFRIASLKKFYELDMPLWGPDLSDLNLDEIIAYLKPDTEMKHNWEDVPENIKNTFERLGIPEAEKKSLAGVGAQFDSEVVYHSIKQELLEKGVIYTDIETALVEHEDILKEYFMTKCLKPTDHIFLALHGAVWSGGSFVYVPKGVKLDMPLQSYFRFNAPGAGQYEHTLIIVEDDADLHFIEGCSAPKYNVNNLHAGCVELFIGKRARLRYSTIENWSKNMYNLNTKKAIVDEEGVIEWVTGSFGSKVSMLYPSAFLVGKRARCEYTGVSFSGEGQNIDTGAQVVHAAPYTTSTIDSRSISKDGGIATYRGLIQIKENAYGSSSSASCESLLLDAGSRADTIPVMDIKNDDIDLAHEAKAGKISEEAIYYLMSRGLSELEAKAMIVRGFVEPISKELPLEYAVEMNNLINLELEGTVG